MTNAHVVAGVTTPLVDIHGSSVAAKVVYYNADLDVAVLSVPTGTIRPLRFSSAEAGDGVAILGFPQNGPYNVQAGRVRADQRLRSPDIYGHGTVIREVLSLRGLIRPGNSGGPVVDSAGHVVGVDRLVDAVWGEHPPATAVATLQSHVSHLRGVLGNRSSIVARAPAADCTVGKRPVIQLRPAEGLRNVRNS